MSQNILFPGLALRLLAFEVVSLGLELRLLVLDQEGDRLGAPASHVTAVKIAHR